MRHLVTLGQGEEEVPNRRTVPYRDFVASEGTDRDQKAGAKGFVDLFIEKRLLVADTDPQGEVTVSVAHEALLREWQRVKEWLTENREFLRMRDRLDSSLKLWLSRGKQKDDLLGPGLPLAEGDKLVKDFGPSLNREQTDYVYASIAERKRRKQTQERLRYAALAAISVLAIVAGFQWFEAEQQRQTAEKNAERAQRNEARSKDLLRAVNSAAFSPDGKWVVTAGADHTARIWETVTGKALGEPLQHESYVWQAAFSPDGKWVVTASADGTARVWETQTGKAVGQPLHHNRVVKSAAFGPDGQRVVTASADGTAQLPVLSVARFHQSTVTG